MDAFIRGRVGGIEPDCLGGDVEFPSHVLPNDPFSAGPMCGNCKDLIPDPWNDKIYRPDLEDPCIANSTDPSSE